MQPPEHRVPLPSNTYYLLDTSICQLTMYAWVLYDISNDKVRRKIAKRCKQLGLYRVQRSVFAGKTRRQRLQHFYTETSLWIDVKTDRILVLRTSKKALNRMLHSGKLPDIPVKGQWMIF